VDEDQGPKRGSFGGVLGLGGAHADSSRGERGMSMGGLTKEGGGGIGIHQGLTKEGGGLGINQGLTKEGGGIGINQGLIKEGGGLGNHGLTKEGGGGIGINQGLLKEGGVSGINQGLVKEAGGGTGKIRGKGREGEQMSQEVPRRNGEEKAFGNSHNQGEPIERQDFPRPTGFLAMPSAPPAQVPL